MAQQYGKKSPALSTVGITSGMEVVEPLVFRQAVDGLHSLINQQGTSVRTVREELWELHAAMKQQGDRLEAKIDAQSKYVMQDFFPNLFRSIHTRVIYVEKSMRKENTSTRGEIESMREENKSMRGEIESMRGEINSMRGEIKSMREEIKLVQDNVQCIVGMLKEMQQGVPIQVPPVIDEQPPSSRSHASGHARSLGYGAGSSSPRHRQDFSTDGVSPSPSRRRFTDSLRHILRSTSWFSSGKKGKGDSQ